MGLVQASRPCRITASRRPSRSSSSPARPFFGDTAFGVRFFSPLFAAITSLLLLRFLAREVGARPSFWLLLAVTATPLLGIGTILMTIDPPLVLCWTWAMVAGWRAAQPDGKTRDWLIVGLAMGLGFLCKYSARVPNRLFGSFFSRCAPAARTHLRKPGPWLALVIFALCTLPVVIWNAQHGWPTLNTWAAMPAWTASGSRRCVISGIFSAANSRC